MVDAADMITTTTTSSTTTANNNTETYGWIAAIVAMLAFGSFGVPIKSDAAKSVDIDPLVFQSYKTSVCFVTAWLVLWCLELEFKFTPWGIVSGLFWVPGGIATVIGVQLAGLAITVGVADACIVLVSFTWGIVIFHEPVHSQLQAWGAVGLMMMGIIGMSLYANPPPPTVDVDVPAEKGNKHTISLPSLASDDYDDQNNLPATATSSQTNNVRRAHDSSGFYLGIMQAQSSSLTTTTTETLQQDETIETEEQTKGLDPDGLFVVENDIPHSNNKRKHYSDDPHEIYCHCACFSLTRQQVGILAAIFTGFWGGSIMAPMKFNTSDLRGLDYLMSFAIGAAIVTLAFWIIRYLWQVYHLQSFRLAYQSLPGFHLSVMWCAGGTSGLIWSIGNLASLLSVLYLGEGVGYSACQAAMLVSGLWGILYFKEVTGGVTICKWMCSACITVVGILLLSYEHHEG